MERLAAPGNIGCDPTILTTWSARVRPGASFFSIARGRHEPLGFSVGGDAPAHHVHAGLDPVSSVGNDSLGFPR